MIDGFKKTEAGLEFKVLSSVQRRTNISQRLRFATHAETEYPLVDVNAHTRNYGSMLLLHSGGPFKIVEDTYYGLESAEERERTQSAIESTFELNVSPSIGDIKPLTAEEMHSFTVQFASLLFKITESR